MDYKFHHGATQATMVADRAIESLGFGNLVLISRLKTYRFWSALPLVAVTVLAGCNSTPGEDFATRPLQPMPVVHVASAGSAVTQKTATNADQYPDFSGPLTAASVQMGDDEASQMSQHLTALAHLRQTGAVSEAEYQRRLAEMQALAKNHGSDTLSQIQN